MTPSVYSSGVQRREVVTLTKRVSHRWGHQVGDVRDYDIGRQGDTMWIRSGRFDITGPTDLLHAIALAIQEVIEARPGVGGVIAAEDAPVVTEGGCHA